MKDKLCLITGVGPGTGKALVKKFASQGYSVIMVARDADRLASIKKEVPNTFAYPCDVSDEAAVNDMASQVVEEIGEPNVVFHNAVRGTFSRRRYHRERASQCRLPAPDPLGSLKDDRYFQLYLSQMDR